MRTLLLLALATTWPDATTRDLVEQSERVCCVRCESSEARLDPGTGLVFTHVSLRLLEDLRGRSDAATIELRLVGGRVGNRATVVDGMPQFPVGKESIVMLGKRNALGYPVVTQAKRGVIHLAKDARGRRVLAGCVTGFRGLEGERNVCIDDFRAAVRR